MTLHMKQDGDWKEIQSFHAKINGEWKEISELYKKENDVWVTVYSGGALLDFRNWTGPIPVSAGWKYRESTETTWTKVTSDGVINDSMSSSFTGYVRAKGELRLDDFYSERVTRSEYGLQYAGTPLSSGRQHLKSFVNNNNGYVCGGSEEYSESYKEFVDSSTVDVYDFSGNRTTGTSLSVARRKHTCFTNSGKSYVCGGNTGRTGNNPSSIVDVYDSSGNRSTGTSLSVARPDATSFANNRNGYVCGGGLSGDEQSTVDVYDSSGNRTTGTSLSVGRNGHTSFRLSNKAYVCGGHRSYNDNYYDTVDVYDSSGNRTTGTSLSSGRNKLESFVLSNKGYVCGGHNSDHRFPTDIVDVYDTSGNRTSATPLNVSRTEHTCFTNIAENRGYICGGDAYPNGWVETDSVEYYDKNGNLSTGNPLSKARHCLTSFVLSSQRGFVCGGTEQGYYGDSTVDIRYFNYEYIYYAYVPITYGSTYTINGTSGTADYTGSLRYETKVSGTVKYKPATLTNVGD